MIDGGEEKKCLSLGDHCLFFLLIMYKVWGTFLKFERFPPANPIKVLQKETSTDFSLAHIDCLF